VPVAFWSVIVYDARGLSGTWKFPEVQMESE
jgi:hypothetical protein